MKHLWGVAWARLRKRQPRATLQSYLGPTDVSAQVTEAECGVFRRLQVYQMLDEVWVLPQNKPRDKGTDDWVRARIMGIGIGPQGRPVYLVGYPVTPDGTEPTRFQVVPYQGPIRRVKLANRTPFLKIVR